MKRLTIALAVLLCATEAYGDVWNAGTFTGTGRTEALTACSVCTTSKMLCINRRATSLTNVVTIYTVTASGAVTAASYTPSTPATVTVGKVLAWGCDATTGFVGGGGGTGLYLESMPLSSPSTFTIQVDSASAGAAFSGQVTATGTGGKTYQIADNCPACSADRMFNFSIPWSSGNLASTASGTGLSDNSELVSVNVANGSFEFLGGYSSGTGSILKRVYASGTTFAFDSVGTTMISGVSEFYKAPFQMNSTLAVVPALHGSDTRVDFINSSGTETKITKTGVDLRPGCSTAAFTGAALGWFVRTTGTLWKTDSVSAPTTITNDATYDVGATPMAGSTATLMVCGLDMDQDGDATDNALVLLADGTHFAWFGSSASIPTAGCSCTPLLGVEPVTTTCTDSSTANGATITAWDWNWGDGSTHSTTQNPSHVYLGLGSHTITHTATNSVGTSGSTTCGTEITHRPSKLGKRVPFVFGPPMP